MPDMVLDISVITPTFNRAGTLPRTLSSVLAQKSIRLEHIIVDNLSKDKTPDLVRDYEARAPYDVIYIREQDTGLYNAMNKGVARARGRAIYILNDDDALLNAEGLQVMMRCLEATQADFVYGNMVWLNPKDQSRSRRRHNQVNKLTLVHKAITQQSILYRASSFEKSGDFDESYRIAGDYKWTLRAFFRDNLSATYLRYPVAICALGGLSNADQSADRSRTERKEAIERWYTPREIRVSKIYRVWLRKIPFGTLCCDWFVPLRLNIRAVHYWRRRFIPDVAAWLGF